MMLSAAKRKKTGKRLILLDAHAILHRAYHALPDFASSKGEPTGALYGLATMILKIIDELKPDYVVAAYDLPQATYRHEAYKDYKAGRKKADPQLVAQMERSRDIFTAFSIPIYDKPGFEADDMLGTICEQMKNEKGLEIVIASGDMDTMQLVDDDKVLVYTLRKGIKDTVLYDEAAVIERYGFAPLLLPDFKGLRGDPSDNIIGIKGIGEKTATILIQKFGTIEEMYKAIKKSDKPFLAAGITPRIIKLLKDGEEEALFSKMLATIRRDAPIDFHLPEKEWDKSVDIKKVEGLFKELEFRTLGIRVKEILGLTDAFGDPISAEDEGKGKTGPAKKGSEIKDGEKTGQQGNISSASKSQELPENELRETAVALWVLDSNITDPQAEDILQFANTDSLVEARKTILAEIKKRDLDKIFTDIELPLIPITKAMHDRGIKIDAKILKKLSQEYHADLDKIENQIWKLAGQKFNINSPRQLGAILFDTLGIKVKNQKKTGTGAKSTRESELEKMREAHPVIPFILEHRELQKLLSTYIDNIPDLLEVDGRLHSTFVQTGSATGRMSSQNPNLQNIPIKSERGRTIRKAFIADTGFKLAAFDYSQIELRIAAILSGDPGLIEIFKSGRDVHTEVAALVFKVPAEKVDKEMRRKAKVINFGILYGMGVNALRQNLSLPGQNVPREEAQTFYDEYFNTFTVLASYLNKVKAEAERKGYTETMFGRRRYFEGLKSKLPYIRAQAERMAINAPIQGTEADIVKIAMIRVDEYVRSTKQENDVRLLLQVHDELVYEVRDGLETQVFDKIQDIMQTILKPGDTKGVPIITHREIGPSWGDMREN
jgi:DNA polymerase-1